MPMNRKTFTVAVLFLILTLLWLGLNIYWAVMHRYCVTGFDLVIAVLFVLAGVGMVCNEFKKKRCRHLYEVNKHKIP